MSRSRDLSTALNQFDGYYVRKDIVQVFSSAATLTTSWSLVVTFDNITNIKANSLIEMDYFFPCRNDSTSWGGVYIEPQVSFNNGTTWASLGTSGYDGGVMHNGVADIGSYYNSVTVDPAITTDFSVRFRFYMRTYDGTGTINTSNDVNLISGTASLLPGNNGLQHFGRINVREIAKRS
jgi:hypothetical protein